MILAEGSGSIYTLYVSVGIAGGILALFAAGVAAFRWAKAKGVADAAEKELVDGDVIARLDKQDAAQKEIDKKITQILHASHANGGDTNQVGDIALRLERGQQQLSDTLQQLVGANTADHANFTRRLDSQSRTLARLASVAEAEEPHART